VAELTFPAGSPNDATREMMAEMIREGWMVTRIFHEPNANCAGTDASGKTL